MPFFPDFTDHGIQHLSDVLSMANALIPGISTPVLTPADIAALPLSVLLHDIGMHLSQDGFVALVQDKSGLRPVLELSDQPWSVLWEHYLSETSRFSGRQNVALHGSPEPVVEPDFEVRDWTEKQYYMIGEFLRRHHALLAHQIGLYGFPGTDLVPLPPTPAHLRNLAGLIARSHGAPIRTAMDYLQHHYGDNLSPFGIHVAYLMALLRIADYLQLNPSRAPVLRQRIQHLRSPVSKREWDKHAAIGYVSFDHLDPDALYAYVDPPNVECYLAIKSLLADIQRELDGCWAILGECYSRHPEFSLLLLSKRRVRSNLDDAVTTDRYPYVPVRASFGAAESDLLKLVIGPLYENKPEIGIRELIQNAVDAVRERYAYSAKRPGEFQSATDIHQVLVNLDETALEISDSGIGMTEDTIRHYFLRAAASFRYSDAWRREFLDISGRSTVLRSGRFGIGVLAAFLLGNEIYVSTRHVSANVGIEFSATLETDPIELRYVERSVGTTVRSRVPEGIMSQLRARNGTGWDWYCLAFPRVVRMIGSAGHAASPLRNAYSIPDLAELPNAKWRVTVIDNGLSVARSYTEGPGIVCNGLLVQHTPPFRSLGSKENGGIGVEVVCPNLSVFDKNGRMPLNLQRTSLGEAARDLLEPVAEDIAYDFLGCASIAIPERPTDDAPLTFEAGLRPESRRVRFHRPDEFEYLPWAHTNRGAVILDPYLLSVAGIRRILLVRQLGRRIKSPAAELYGVEDFFVPPMLLADLPDDTAVVGLYVPQGRPYLSQSLAATKDPLRGSPFDGFILKGFRVCSVRQQTLFVDTSYILDHSCPRQV